jgi:predicted DNA binding CopG/RHH family protein
MAQKVFPIKLSDHFRKHIEKQAVRRGLPTGTFIKAVLKKYTRYKEPELL